MNSRTESHLSKSLKLKVTLYRNYTHVKRLDKPNQLWWGVVKYEPSLFFFRKICNLCKSARALAPSLQSKQFSKSSPNPNECTLESNMNVQALIQESQRFRKKRTAYTKRRPNFHYFIINNVTLSQKLVL